jgi:hypothetical protein
MKRDLRWMAFPLAALAALACALANPGSTVGDQPASDTPLPRATPYSLEPAAGICAEPDGDEAVMRLEPGIPDPRCLIVQAGQRLRVVNRTGADVAVSIGPFSLVIPANGETVFGPPLGDYLLPGVHALQVDPCCGGELWLKEN